MTDETRRRLPAILTALFVALSPIGYGVFCLARWVVAGIISGGAR
jgi:hypothetical protein